MKPFTFPVVLPADAAIDLQLHTIYSDGTWMPAQLIDYLISEQFGLAAITDHDRPETAAELQQLAAEKQFSLLTAVEISASWRRTVCWQTDHGCRFLLGHEGPG